jgi:hypothetical protein
MVHTCTTRHGAQWQIHMLGAPALPHPLPGGGATSGGLSAVLRAEGRRASLGNINASGMRRGGPEIGATPAGGARRPDPTWK